MDLVPIPELLFQAYEVDWQGARPGFRIPPFFFLREGVYPSFSKRAAIDLEVNRERQH